MKKLLILIFGICSYFIFLITFLYAIGFVGNIYVSKSIDSIDSADVSMSTAIITNLILLSIFALQHSIMARPNFKVWWTKIFDPAVERSIYVLLSSAALILMYWQWIPMNGTVWSLQNYAAIFILNALFWAGWGIVLISTFLINHFHLFGLLQVFENFKNKSLSYPEFKENLFYKIVRHPIMLGFIIAFWATPVMTQGHLLFAVVTTIYILVAVKYLEERDLLKMHGEVYESYKRRTSMIIPLGRSKK